MTPEERARALVEAYEASEKLLPGIGYVHSLDLEEMVLTAVRAAVETEREECAKVADAITDKMEDALEPDIAGGASWVAEAIRARGEAK